jgi:AcrR family transcriptional regulator
MDTTVSLQAMPRHADHDENRRHIVDALCRVTVRDGLGAVSFREVAAEAGVSVRRLQYYFGTKAGLLRGALDAIDARAAANAREAMSRLAATAPPRELLRTAIIGSLPTTDENREQSLLFFSFFIAGITDRSLNSGDALSSPRWTVPWTASVIRRGSLRAGIDADKEGLLLMMTYAGLSLAILAGQVRATDAEAAIDYQLDRIFRAGRR